MFRRRADPESASQTAPIERVTSVLGTDTVWHGRLTGSGGVRIEGAFEGEIVVQGLLVIGDKGRVTCENVRAHTVVVAGNLKGNITAQKVEIRSTGRVWGDVTTMAFATEEGSFLRGKITMEEKIALEGENEAEQ